MSAIAQLIAAAALVALAAPALADPGHGRGRGSKFETGYEARGAAQDEDKGRGHKDKNNKNKEKAVAGVDRGERDGKEHKYWHKVKKHDYRTAAYDGCGGPPPWAPAWGYRRQHREVEPCAGPWPYATPAASYVAPFGIALGRCDRNQVGDVVGNAVGNATSNFMQTRVGSDAQVASLAGAVVGALVSAKVGGRMDRIDRACIGQVLEYAPDGRSIVWSQAADGPRYRVVPLATYQTSSGGYCREYQTTALIGSQAQREYGIACRQPSGWQVAS
jgi:surface antigen